MNTTRVFLSFHVPETISTRIIGDIPRLSTVTPYPKANLHCTLKFIGDVTPEDMLALAAAVTPLAAQTPPLFLTPVRFVVAEQRLRLALELDYALLAFQAQIAAALEPFAFVKKDLNSYTPHITLGRAQPTFDPAVIPLTNIPRYAFSATEFGLYQSVPGRSNLGEYTLLQSFALGGK